MNTVHPTIAAALRPFAPLQSSVHQPTEAELIAADLAGLEEKILFHQRNDRRAFELQIKQQACAELFGGAS